MDETGEHPPQPHSTLTSRSVAPLFIELQELVSRVPNGLEFDSEIFQKPATAHSMVLWLETARWIDFEENYNEIEQRFTEAHVSPMRYSHVVQLRREIENHLQVIETDSQTLGHALEEVATHAINQNSIASENECDVLKAILFSERWHPAVKGFISDTAEFEKYWSDAHPRGDGMAFRTDKNSQSMTTTNQTTSQSHHSAFRSLVNIHHHSQHPYHRYNPAITSQLQPGSEACTVLCGVINFLLKPILVLLRLRQCINKSCISEADVPVRFIFIYIGPDNTSVNYYELTRVFAVMMSNPAFRAYAYEAFGSHDLLMATSIFMDDSLVMPLSRYSNPETLAGMVRQLEIYRKELGDDNELHRRARRPVNLCGFSSRKTSTLEMLSLRSPSQSRKPSAFKLALQDGALTELVESRSPVHRSASGKAAAAIESKSGRKRFLSDFCPPFIDFCRGMKPWWSRFGSDFTDAFKKDNFAIVFSSVLFLYFVNLSPSITFGALLTSQVDESFTTSMTILGSGVYLVLFTLLSGQPLGFIGVSAPIFIIESAIKSVASATDTDLGIMRFWVAIYCAIFGLLCIFFNTSVLANHIRRSVEEVFNSFIAFFFLLKSLFSMLNVRKILGALNVPLGMILIVVLNLTFFSGYSLDTIDIPPSNRINASRWLNTADFSLIESSGASSSLKVHLPAIFIGLAMNVIVFTEAALNGITAMKNKAVKPNIFSMDILLLLIVFPLTSGLTGWPFVSGATVRTMSNLAALVKLEHSSAPGKPQRIIGTVEQRVSGILVGLLVGASIFLGSILSLIPIAALYGMFLYMGVMGLRDLQFFLRCISLLKRRKHWEDWECLRGLPSRHILVFSSIQAFVIAILVTLNIVAEYTKAEYIALLFPIVILIYAVVREIVLPKWTWLAVYLHQKLVTGKGSNDLFEIATVCILIESSFPIIHSNHLPPFKLDRKYKLNPSTVKPLTAVKKPSFHVNQESVVSFTNYAQQRQKLERTDVQENDSDSSSEYSEHEDGVIRQTWAT